MRQLIENGRLSLHFLIGVATLVAGIMFLVAALRSDSEALLLSLVMIAMGGFQVVAWLTRKPASAERTTSWQSYLASRFGGAFAGIGIALLIFDHTNGWRIAMGIVYVIMGSAIVYLSNTTSRR